MLYTRLVNFKMVRGRYPKKKVDPDSLTYKDFECDWSFWIIMSQTDEKLFAWLQARGLLARYMECDKCQVPMKLSKDKRRWRCPISNNHDYSYKRFSFYTGTHFNIRDILLFIRNMLNQRSLYRSSISSGMSYSGTSVNWSRYMRDIFKLYFVKHIDSLQLKGIIEIDETLLGRRQKYNKGKRSGMKVWLFGLLERNSDKKQPDRIIIYPVESRDRPTLVWVIKKHVAPGETIYSDNWTAYSELTSLGYKHFTVCHKYNYMRLYEEQATGMCQKYSNKIILFLTIYKILKKILIYNR